jgi:hypothetical protein
MVDPAGISPALGRRGVGAYEARALLHFAGVAAGAGVVDGPGVETVGTGVGSYWNTEQADNRQIRISHPTTVEAR